MSIVIIGNTASFNFMPCDFVDGQAYQCVSGDIYIGNSINGKAGRMKGFSVCGRKIAWETDVESLYREVNLEIRVL